MQHTTVQQKASKQTTVLDRAMKSALQYETKERVEFLARVRPDRLLRDYEALLVAQGDATIRGESLTWVH